MSNNGRGGTGILIAGGAVLAFLLLRGGGWGLGKGDGDGTGDGGGAKPPKPAATWGMVVVREDGSLTLYPDWYPPGGKKPTGGVPTSVDDIVSRGWPCVDLRAEHGAVQFGLVEDIKRQLLARGVYAEDDPNASCKPWPKPGGV